MSSLEFRDFIAMLYQGASSTGFVEIRFLRGGQKRFMQWPTSDYASDLFDPKKDAPKGKDVYFGVCLRASNHSSKGSGGKDNCVVSRVNWIDVDLKDHLDITHGQKDLLDLPADELDEYKQELMQRVLDKSKKLGIPIRQIVDSGHGLQVYFLGTAFTHEYTEECNKRLAHAFGGDPKCYDTARILRVPGTFNLKNPKRPLEVKVIYQNGHPKEHFTAQPCIAFGDLKRLPLPEGTTADQEPKEAPKTQVAPAEPQQGDSVIKQWNEKNSIVDVLLRYGYIQDDALTFTRPGDDASGRDVKLLENPKGVLCSYHHSSNDPLHNTSVGTEHLLEPFDLWCHYEHGGDFKQAVRAAAEELQLPKMSPQATKRRARISASSKPRLEGSIAAKTSTTEKATEPVELQPSSGVYLKSGAYYIDRPVKKGGEIVDWTEERLTNFTFTPELILVQPDGSRGFQGTLKVKGAREHVVKLAAENWNSRSHVLEAVGRYEGRCLTNSNADVAKIGDYLTDLYSKLPEAHGVRCYGLHELDTGPAADSVVSPMSQRIQLYENGVRGLAEGKPQPLFYSGPPMGDGAEWFQAPPVASPEQVDQARRVVTALPRLVTPAVALSVLGYCAASAFAPLLVSFLGKRMPFLYIAGERESGKTSCAQIGLSMATGSDKRIAKARGLSNYQYDLAFSNVNNLVGLLDEYRPQTIDDAQLRKHHDLSTKWRGTGLASSNISYELCCPLMVCGEGFSEDAATLSRGVLYFTRKKDRGSLRLYNELTRDVPIAAYSGHLHALARSIDALTLEARVARALELAEGLNDGNINPRLMYALMFIGFGLLTLQADTENIADESIIETLQAGVQDSLGEGKETTTNLESFLEQLCFVLTRVPNPLTYVTPARETGTVVIRPRICVDLVKAHYRDDSAVTNTRMFQKLAAESEYFYSGDVHKSYEGKPVRGKRLILSGVPSRCEIDYVLEIEEKARLGGHHAQW